MEQLKKFARYFAPYKWHVFAGIFFILLSMAFGLYVPYLVGEAIDDFKTATWNGSLSVEKISVHAGLILGASLLSGFFLFWQRRLLINASRHIEYDMRRDFYAARYQPIEYFQKPVGDDGAGDE